VGYRYGEHKYGERLYSRWPDWWHDKACENERWVANDCLPSEFAPMPVEPAIWQKQAVGPVIWADDPAKVPHPEQWRPTQWRKTV